MRVILTAAFFVAALGKVTVTKQPHVRKARTSKRGDNLTDPPPPCECEVEWTDSEGGKTCGDVQFGCPQSACDGYPDRWCIIANPGCATELDEGGWSYCDDSNAPKEPSGNLLVISGSEYCTVNATSSCVTDGPEDYGNREDCTISVLAGGRLVSDGFNTEYRYDVLTIDGTDYSGNDVDVNVRVDPGATIKWTSDGSDVQSGWKICFVESGVYDIDAVCTTFKDCASLCCSDGLGQDCTSTEARSVTGSCCAPGTDDLCKTFEKCESDEDCAVDSHTCGIYGACGNEAYSFLRVVKLLKVDPHLLALTINCTTQDRGPKSLQPAPSAVKTLHLHASARWNGRTARAETPVATCNSVAHKVLVTVTVTLTGGALLQTRVVRQNMMRMGGPIAMTVMHLKIANARAHGALLTMGLIACTKRGAQVPLVTKRP